MKRLAVVLLIMAGIVVTGVIMSHTPEGDNKKEEEKHHNYYQISGAKIPDQLAFAGEPTPINKFFVREALDKEMQVNTYWHSSTLLLLKRANRWFPVIEPILEKNGIPSDFKYLALIESGLENVESPAGAAGFWQLLEGTAEDHGLEVNKDVDERYHLEKSTQVACEYLNEAYEDFGDWTLAAAAYNAGKRRIRNAVRDQKVNSYYNLYLNQETSRYVYRILAIKTIYENQSLFGFSLSEEDLYQSVPYREVSFNNEIRDLIRFAIDNGTSYKMLKTLNPWLVNDILRNSTRKKYTLKLPVEKEK